MSPPLFDLGIEGENCRLLWVAVLTLAIDDATGNRRRDCGDHARNEAFKVNHATRAIAWFTSAAVSPGSFRWVCAVLDLDPDRVRNLLHKKFEAATITALANHRRVTPANSRLRAAAKRRRAA